MSSSTPNKFIPFSQRKASLRLTLFIASMIFLSCFTGNVYGQSTHLIEEEESQQQKKSEISIPTKEETQEANKEESWISFVLPSKEDNNDHKGKNNKDNKESGKEESKHSSDSDSENYDIHKDLPYSIFCGFSLIFISEIGDKTFILALYFSIKIGVLPTYATTSLTLICLNAFWLIVGASLPFLVYQGFINWFAICLFLFFSIVLLIEGLKMEDKKIIEDLQELEEEKEHEADEVADNDLRESLLDEENRETAAVTNKIPETEKKKNKDKEEDIANDETKESSVEKKKDNSATNPKHKEPVHVKKVEVSWSIIWGFSMSLILAECGDRSQITAVAIAAIYNFFGVLIGSSIAHAMAALIAVSIGGYFSERVSAKMITLFGSGIFFIYAMDFLIHRILRSWLKSYVFGFWSGIESLF